MVGWSVGLERQAGAVGWNGGLAQQCGRVAAWKLQVGIGKWVLHADFAGVAG